MKSIIKSFLLIAVAAVTVFSCTKEIDVKIVGEPEPSHRVSIRVSSVDTKTVINEGISSASFKWSSDDASRFYLKENAVEGTDIEISSDDSYETITIGATFATESAASYTYSGFLAKNMTAGKKPRVPATQTSTASAYDPDADVLVAKPLDFGSPQDELELQFTRPVVIN